MNVQYNLDLTEYNSYRIHSVARVAYFPESKDELIDVVQKKHPIIIGGGCNVILSKDIYEQPIVFIRENYSSIKQITGEQLLVMAGTDLKVLSEYAFEQSMTGLEYFYDIPGCVGGATIMNAGCNGVSFGDFIDFVTYFDVDKNKIITKSSNDLFFQYRGSQLSVMNIVILEVGLS